MAWNTRKQNIYDVANELETDKKNEEEELREAWNKYTKACHELGEKELAEFKAKSKKPILMFVTTGSNISYLVKADARIQTNENRAYLKLAIDKYDKFPPSEPIPLETNPHWHIPVKDKIKESWTNRDNIVLEIADGITTVLLKYEDIEILQCISISSYDDIKELRTLTDDSGNNNVILGVYPELQEDMEKWSKE